PTAPEPQASQPHAGAPHGSQGEHSLRRPKQPPQPPQGFPSPQQPIDTLDSAAKVVKISSLLMAELSSTKPNREDGEPWVEQLYTTVRDVQTQRAGIFFATR